MVLWDHLVFTTYSIVRVLLGQTPFIVFKLVLPFCTKSSLRVILYCIRVLIRKKINHPMLSKLLYEKTWILFFLPCLSFPIISFIFNTCNNTSKIDIAVIANVKCVNILFFFLRPRVCR